MRVPNYGIMVDRDVKKFPSDPWPLVVTITIVTFQIHKIVVCLLIFYSIKYNPTSQNLGRKWRKNLQKINLIS